MYDDAGPKEARHPHPGRAQHNTLHSDHREIFRELIAGEVRAGRMTRAHRQRIVRYAAQLGLSAVEAGQLIQLCRQEALHSDDPIAQRHALRLVEPPPALSFSAKLGLTLAGAIFAHLLIRVMT